MQSCGQRGATRIGVIRDVAGAIARCSASPEAKAIAPVARPGARGAHLDVGPLQPHDPYQRRAAILANDVHVAGRVRKEQRADRLLLSALLAERNTAEPGAELLRFVHSGSDAVDLICSRHMNLAFPGLPEGMQLAGPGTVHHDASVRDVYQTLINVDKRPDWLEGADTIDRDLTSERIGMQHNCIFHGFTLINKSVFAEYDVQHARYSERCVSSSWT
jgi:hypothetical protein